MHPAVSPLAAGQASSAGYASDCGAKSGRSFVTMRSSPRFPTRCLRFNAGFSRELGRVYPPKIPCCLFCGGQASAAWLHFADLAGGSHTALRSIHRPRRLGRRHLDNPATLSAGQRLHDGSENCERIFAANLVRGPDRPYACRSGRLQSGVCAQCSADVDTAVSRAP